MAAAFFSKETSATSALEQIKALLAERVAQAQRGELADGSVTEIADRAIQASDEQVTGKNERN